MAAEAKTLNELRREVLDGALADLLRRRVVLMPMILALAAAIVWLDPSPWRVGVMIGVAAGVLALALGEGWGLRRRGVRSWTTPYNVAAMGALQFAVVFATGALESPALPAQPMISVIGGLLIGRRRALAWLPAAQIVGVLALTVGEITGRLPDVNLPIFGGGVRAGHNDALLVCAAAFLCLVIVVGAALGAHLRLAFDRLAEGAWRARSLALEAERERNREMTALTAEIAHELKNPLASVVGLAALVARDVPEGRVAERLEVLRREADRLQEILEGFLNFSRPLTPLARERVDLAALVDDVIALYEASAAGRGVALGRGGAGRASCDPRKIRQVVINLLENALAVAPAGSRLRLEVSGGPGGATLAVLDEGPGPPPDLAERLFEPGVSGREGGAGIGLTIARTIARQHGGELRLAARQGGPGCAVTLTLPPAGAP